jgi:hypothetical protein
MEPGQKLGRGVHSNKYGCSNNTRAVAEMASRSGCNEAETNMSNPHVLNLEHLERTQSKNL